LSPTTERVPVVPVDTPAVIAHELEEISAAEVATMAPKPWPAPPVAVPAVEQATLEPSPRETTTHIDVPPVEQAILEMPVPAKAVKEEAESVENIKQAKLISDIEEKNRALQNERKKLAKERKLLEKKLAAQRAETKRLKRKSEAEKKRMEKLVTLERKKNARAAMWEEFSNSTPEAYSEDD